MHPELVKKAFAVGLTEALKLFAAIPTKELASAVAKSALTAIKKLKTVEK